MWLNTRLSINSYKSVIVDCTNINIRCSIDTEAKIKNTGNLTKAQRLQIQNYLSVPQFCIQFGDENCRNLTNSPLVSQY